MADDGNSPRNLAKVMDDREKILSLGGNLFPAGVAEAFAFHIQRNCTSTMAMAKKCMHNTGYYEPLCIQELHEYDNCSDQSLSPILDKFFTSETYKAHKACWSTFPDHRIGEGSRYAVEQQNKLCAGTAAMLSHHARRLVGVDERELEIYFEKHPDRRPNASLLRTEFHY